MMGNPLAVYLIPAQLYLQEQVEKPALVRLQIPVLGQLICKS